MEYYEITYSYQGPCSSGHPAPSKLTLQDDTTRQYSVTGFEEFSDYIITIAAVNGMGRSYATSTTTRTLSTGMCVCVHVRVFVGWGWVGVYIST